MTREKVIDEAGAMYDEFELLKDKVTALQNKITKLLNKEDIPELETLDACLDNAYEVLDTAQLDIDEAAHLAKE